MPGPKVVVATGACALGGVYPEDPFTRGTVDSVLPVDVWIPGCPPSPLALLHGLGVAVGRLAEKVRDLPFTAPGYPERDGGSHDPAGLPLRGGHSLARRHAGWPARRADRGRIAGMLRPVSARRRRGWSLLYGDTPVVSPGGATLTGGPPQLQATSLAGVFTALLGVVAVAILYACRALSTYKIAAITGTDRQRITRLLRKAGIAVKPRGAGRRKTRPPEDERLRERVTRLLAGENA